MLPCGSKPAAAMHRLRRRISCNRCATSTSTATHEAIFIGLTKAAAVCSKASIRIKRKMGETNHEALRFDRAEPAHCPHVHGGKGHRNSKTDRRPARRRKSA